MATLLAICQAAIRETGQYVVPTTIVGNTDPTAVQLLALANRVGKSLARDYVWQALMAEHTFATVASTANYSLPSDFHKFSNLSFWDQTNYEHVRGPVSVMEWQTLRSSSVAVGSPFNQVFHIDSDSFYIYPTPTAVATISYWYYSKNWIYNQQAFALDTDEPVLDGDLFTQGVKWRFLQAKGDSYQEEKADYLRTLESLQGQDGGKDAIRFGDGAGPREWPAGNIPDVGFGA